MIGDQSLFQNRSFMDRLQAIEQSPLFLSVHLTEWTIRLHAP